MTAGSILASEDDGVFISERGRDRQCIFCLMGSKDVTLHVREVLPTRQNSTLTANYAFVGSILTVVFFSQVPVFQNCLAPKAATT